MYRFICSLYYVIISVISLHIAIDVYDQFISIYVINTSIIAVLWIIIVALILKSVSVIFSITGKMSD